ncbi:beta-lactamase/transpeptidase-like protein [Infundibulicybe gibba]|nr:beta-lactamase/transpeptidase-like protein [Infundibulicybe gibba]
MKKPQFCNPLVLWLSVVGLPSLGSNHPSQAPFNKVGEKPALDANIESFIHGVLDEWNSPGGVAVAVVRMNDQGTWNVETKGYGRAKADGTPVDENTLFSIASNSKLFTAIATGLLVSNETLEPRVEWSSKIASLIPGWELMDPIATQESTILDLMGHRTGQPRDDLMYGRRDDTNTILRKIKHLKPSAGFRETWQYNNNMYSFLSNLPSLLIPGTNFIQYVKENIFEPLGMSSTTYSTSLAEGMARQGVNMSEDIFGGGIPRALPFWFQEDGTLGNFTLGAGGVIMNAIDAVRSRPDNPYEYFTQPRQSGYKLFSLKGGAPILMPP